jgi:hypothetical protein
MTATCRLAPILAADMAQDDGDRRRCYADGFHELGQRRRSKLRRPQPDLLPGCRGGLRYALARTARCLRPVRSARGLVPGRVGDIVAMAASRLARLFWRVVDALDYLVTLARLRILDMLAGPEPETPADQQRARDREGIKRVFPEIDP